MRRLLGRIAWADVIVDVAAEGVPGRRVLEMWAGRLGRRIVKIDRDGISTSPSANWARDVLSSLDLEAPPARVFPRLGADLRRRQDEIWAEIPWPPPDPRSRMESDQELSAVLAQVRTAGDWALDVGAGAGRGAMALAGRNRHVAAMDLSLHMLRLLRDKAGAAGGAVHLVLGDAERLPFRSRVFSVATGLQVCAHVETPERFTDELARVTRPGANVVLSTGNAQSLVELADRLILFLHELRHGRVRKASAALRGDRVYWLKLRGFARSSLAKLGGQLASSGFRIQHRLTVGVVRAFGFHLPEAWGRLPGLRRFSRLIVVSASHEEAPRAVQSYAKLSLAAIPRFVHADGSLLYRQGLHETRRDSEPPSYSTTERYRLICLIGLEAYRRSQGASPDVNSLISQLGRALGPRALDDEGLFLWWKALAGEGGVEPSLERIAAAIPRLGGEDSQTLAFLLMGLASGRDATKRAGQWADEVAAHLLARQSKTGLFATVARRDPVSTFNYQVYSSLALATYGGQRGRGEAVEAARACCDRFCRLQGPQGQWWWTYDIERGTVADKYPVFTVHQLGMAPLVLLAVGRISGDDFTPWVRRGARWVAGPNEVGQPLITGGGATVWRSVRRRGAQHPWASAVLLRLAWHRFGRLAALWPGKEINREHRPYEYGWLLAALAEARGDESWLP
ncbi:MAG TPA: class I SAM-dependent methyltransferase [Vicinamibacteria bacterium]|nr:class I SAM-dependent methyltransferase [Vicinamibacteria bacterium]